MGVLQQGFNQALTGATFLLQQTPGWQEMAEYTRSKKEFETISRQRDSLLFDAKRIANSAKSSNGTDPILGIEDKDGEGMKYERDRAYYLETEAQDKFERMKNIARQSPKLFDKKRQILSIDGEDHLASKAIDKLIRKQSQYNKQKEQQMQYKTQLKQQDANELAAMGVSKEAIEKARYN